MKAKSQIKTEPVLVSAAFLAVRYGLAKKTIREWAVDEGFLPYVRLSPRCLRYPLAECDERIKSRLVPAVA